MSESARMHSNPLRAIAFLAALAALVLAATAWADTGGTAASKAPPVQSSGGVAGPAVTEGAHSAQNAAQEQPPQVETTPTETTPSPNNQGTGTVPNTAPTAPTQAPAATGVSSGGGGGSSGGLPTTGLELGGLAAVGLGLLLAGVALRRRPTI
jgi:hypothetical protein